MIGTPPFPTAPDQLTASFLSAALGTPVRTFSTTTIGVGRGMLGDLVIVEPTYDDHAPGPERVVAKFAADREGSLASARRSGSHARELRFYDEIAPVTAARVPRTYGAWYDPETAKFLLLQDAVEADPGVDQLLGIGPERVRLVIRETAKLHARWWRSDRLAELEWLPRLDSVARRSNLAAIAAAGWPLLRDLLDPADLVPAVVALGDSLAERIDAALVELAGLPATLVHSDLRADNLLFDPSAPVVTIVDWQGAGIGPPSWDLAYLLSQSLTAEDRRAHEADLIDEYRRALCEAGVDVGLDEILVGYAPRWCSAFSSRAASRSSRPPTPSDPDHSP
ncbi:MAG: phosphotransferase [Ilumatobacteraceae bacterium]